MYECCCHCCFRCLKLMKLQCVRDGITQLAPSFIDPLAQHHRQLNTAALRAIHKYQQHGFRLCMLLQLPLHIVRRQDRVIWTSTHVYVHIPYDKGCLLTTLTDLTIAKSTRGIAFSQGSLVSPDTWEREESGPSGTYQCKLGRDCSLFTLTLGSL